VDAPLNTGAPASDLGLPPPEEPTLAAMLRAFAHDQVPSRFYLFLQLGLPWAVQFWLWGWPRTSALLFALSMFGIWALCEQAIVEKAIAADGAHAKPLSAPSAKSAQSQYPPLNLPANPTSFAKLRSRGSHGSLLRIARRLSGFVAGATAFGLLFESVVRALFAVIRCPGCAS
jgi:hypothetical protein